MAKAKRKLFNFREVCLPDSHFMLPDRLPEARRLVADGKYFAVDDPAMTGKASVVKNMADEMNVDGSQRGLELSRCLPWAGDKGASRNCGEA